MKLLGVNGSPRKGNSQRMLEEVLKGAEGAGAKTELLLLRELDIAHCDGCDSCIETKECKLKDDFQQLLEKLVEADAIVLSTPTYFDNMSGIMKDMVDRSNCLYATRQLKGKKGYAVVSGGQGKKSLEKCLETLKSFYKHEFMEFCGAVLGEKLEEPGAAAGKNKLMKECRELGKKIVSDQL